MHDKPYAFLGQYLVGNGFISEAQLVEAVHLQKQNNSLVGTIAFDQGFLDSEQLDYLLRRQVQVDERIGKLAVQEGFLTDEQLETVLSIQGENHIFLGESLVRLGTLDHETLNGAIGRFESQILAQDREVREVTSHLPASREILITLDVTLRFFYRLGYAIRVLAASEDRPEDVPHVFSCEQIFKRQRHGYMGIGMTGVLLKSIAQDAGRHRSSSPTDLGSMESMSQLIFNLNSVVCRRMKQEGIRVRLGAAFIGPPPAACQHNIWIAMETVTNPIALTYGH